MKLVEQRSLLGVRTVTGFAEWIGPNTANPENTRHAVVIIDDRMIEFEARPRRMPREPNELEYDFIRRRSSVSYDCVAWDVTTDQTPRHRWVRSLPLRRPTVVTLHQLDHQLWQRHGVYSVIAAVSEDTGLVTWEVGCFISDTMRSTFWFATDENCVTAGVL